MRILYLTEEEIRFSEPMIRGGAIHVRNVVSGLLDRGHEVVLVDWNKRPERPYQYSVRPVFRFGLDPLRTTLGAVRVGRDRDVDVVVSKTRKTYLPGLAAATRLGVPHVAHVGTVPDATTGSLLSRIEGLSVALRLRAPHDAYFVVGDSVADLLVERGVDERRVYDVRNAVDTEAFSPDREDVPETIANVAERHDGRFRVGFVGGLYWYKGLEHMATALDRCETDAVALVAGDGPEREDLEARFGDNAEFLGIVPYDEVPAVYRVVDAFVLPSYTETLSRVVLEAQASGTPVIATAVGGVPEIVTHEENGLLCPPRDPDCLANAIDRLAGDPALRDQLATNGRHSVLESWSWDAMLDRYERFLSAVVD